MRKYLTILVTMAVGLAAGMPWTTVEAGGSSGTRSMERIVHRDDRVVFAIAFGNAQWDNPDSCDNAKKVALVPEDPVLYAEFLETLRAAMMAARQVSFQLDGCYVQESGISVPKIKWVSVW